MILIELLSHISFFTVFLTVFYVTYVGYIQSKSMVSEFTQLLNESFQSLVVIFPPQIISAIQSTLSISKTFVDPSLDKLVQQQTGSNQQLLTPVYIGVFTGAALGIGIAIILTIMYGGSVWELFYTNLISLSFIAITDFIIVALYGQFRLIDTQYLAGLFSVKAAGGTPNCALVEQTLDSIFTWSFLQNIINNFLISMGQAPKPSQPLTPTPLGPGGTQIAHPSMTLV